MLNLLEMVLHSIRDPDVLRVTERRIENVNLFVIDLANMYSYVLNTRTLFATTVLSLILILLLLLFYFCLCLFASVFEVYVIVYVYLQVVWRFV